MISSNQSLPPLMVVSGITALDQNTANQTGSQKSGEQLFKRGEQQLKPGQEVAVKVVASDGGGRYTLDVGSQRIEVQSRLPLQVGQQLNMLVQEGDDGLVFAFKGIEVGQFLTRAMATGGSNQALGMIFGQGLAAQARSGALVSQTGGVGATLQSTGGATESQATGATTAQMGKGAVLLQSGSGAVAVQTGKGAVVPQSESGVVAAQTGKGAVVPQNGSGGGAAQTGKGTVLPQGGSEAAAQKIGNSAALPQRGGEAAAQKSGGRVAQGGGETGKPLFFTREGAVVREGGVVGKAVPAQNMSAASSAKGAAEIPAEGSVTRLPAPAIATKMVELQQQFVQKSVSSQPVAARAPGHFNTAVQQFTTELGRQITPLLGEGKVAEAMEHVASGLRSLARFFPPRAGGALPPGLTPSQRQLFEAFSALQQPESRGATGGTGGQGREVALGRVVQQLQSQLTPASAPTGGMTQPQQSPQAMLAALNSILQGLQELVQLPAAFQHQPVSAPVFRSGLDGLFAFHLGFGRVGEGGTSSGFFSTMQPMSAMVMGGEVSSGAILQQLVDGLGLDMEKLLAKGDLHGAAQGLKFQLLRQMEEGGEQIEREMQASGAKGSKSVEESGLFRQAGESHQALQSINFLQILQANLDKQGLLALPLPLPFLEQGFLLMENHKEGENGGEGQDEGTRFSVLMKLSSLGNVRVDLLQTKESVYLRIHTESPEVTKLFQESQQELRAGLSPLQLQGLSYSSDPPGDPVAVLLQKCEGSRSSSLFEASV